MSCLRHEAGSILAPVLLVLAFAAAADDAGAEKFQRFILTAEPHAEAGSLTPLISEFGRPAEAQIRILSALSMIVVGVPASWRVDADAFCRRMTQAPSVRSCMPDFAVEIQQPGDSSELRAESLSSRHQCKPWYLGAGNCPGPPSPANVHAGEAWTYSTGSDDVVVAVLDNGFDFSFPNIRDNIWRNAAEIAGRRGVDDDGNGYIDDLYGWDAVEGDGIPANVCLPGENPRSSLRFHGTRAAQFVASINQGRHVSGVAWRTKLMALRYLSCARRSANFSAFPDAINYVMMNRKNGVNVRAINFSSGFSLSTTPAQQIWDEVLRDLSEHNVVFVMSAGNRGRLLPSASSTPAVFSASKNLIVVGGVNRNGSLIWSWHPEHVDLAAPARSLPVYNGSLDKPPIASVSGTSFSAPQVAGALALLYAYRPRLSIDQARIALLAGVTRLPSLQGRNASGGTLNAAGMFRQLPGLAIDLQDGGHGTAEASGASHVLCAVSCSSMRQRIAASSSISFTLSLTHTEAAGLSSIAVPVSLSVEDTAGASGMARVLPRHVSLTADRSSQTITLYAGETDALRRSLILYAWAADDAMPPDYAGASRNIPILIFRPIKLRIKAYLEGALRP